MKCPKCSSTLGYFRLKTKVYICRSCGETSEIKTVKKAIKNIIGV